MNQKKHSHKEKQLFNLKSKFTFRKKLAVMGFTLYITFILLSMIPYIAESQFRSRQEEMDKKYDYHLIFPLDGIQSHYYVERMDTFKNGEIFLTYTTLSHTLEVEARNVKKLTIYCKSIYYDESNKIFKRNPNEKEDYYLDYFIKRGPFTVNVFTDTTIELCFKDAPEPDEVYVDDSEWWKTNTNYTFNGRDIVLTNVSKGGTYVQIYFQEHLRPEAKFSINGVNTYQEGKNWYGYKDKDIIFDAKASHDNADGGSIDKYIWYFDDDIHDTGQLTAHRFSKTGIYNVTLTVIDNYGLRDDYTQSTIIVEFENDKDTDDGSKKDTQTEDYLLLILMVVVVLLIILILVILLRMKSRGPKDKKVRYEESPEQPSQVELLEKKIHTKKSRSKSGRKTGSKTKKHNSKISPPLPPLRCEICNANMKEQKICSVCGWDWGED